MDENPKLSFNTIQDTICKYQMLCGFGGSWPYRDVFSTPFYCELGAKYWRMLKIVLKT